MKTIIIFYFLFSPYLYGFTSQDIDTSMVHNDSIIHLITESTIGNKEIERIIWQSFDDKKYDEAKEYTYYFLEKGIIKDDDEIKFRAYYLLSYIHYSLAEFYKTIDYSEKGINLVNLKNKKDQIFPLLLYKAASYKSIGNYEKAISTYIEAKNSNSKANTTASQLISNLSLGNCRIRIKRYLDAQKDFESVLNILANSQDTNKQYYAYNAYNGLGICQRELKNYDEAIGFFKKSLDNFKHTQNQERIAINLMNIGRTYFLKEDYKNSEKQLIASKNIFSSENIKNENSLIATYFLADLYNKVKEYEKSFRYSKESYLILKENPKMGYAVESLELGINNAQTLNDPQTELAYSKLLSTIQKDLYNDRSTAKDIIFEEQTKTLNNNNQKLFDKIKINNVIITFITLFFCCFILFSIYYNQKTRRKNHLLFKQLEKRIKEKKPFEKNKKSIAFTVDDTKAKVILEELKELEKACFFKNIECTLHSTAQALKTNTTYLSQVINQYKKKSFNDYINELRIYYVLEEFKKNTKYHSFTIKGISEDIGYKSVNTFNNSFKKITSISPSFYLKQISKQNLIEV